MYSSQSRDQVSDQRSQRNQILSFTFYTLPTLVLVQFGLTSNYRFFSQALPEAVFTLRAHNSPLGEHEQAQISLGKHADTSNSAKLKMDAFDKVYIHIHTYATRQNILDSVEKPSSAQAQRGTY